MTRLNELTPDNNPYDKDSAIDWLLQTLIKHGGQTNLYPLHGKNSPKSEDIIWAQNLLASQSHIRRVHNAIGVTFAITEEGKRHFYKRVYDKVVARLAKANEFVKVSSILTDLRIENNDDELSDAIEAKLIKEDKVFATEESGVMLKPSAKDELLQSKFQLVEKKEQAAVHNDHSIKVEGDYIHAPDNSGQILNKSPLTEASVSQQTNPPPKTPEKKPWWKSTLDWVWEQIKKPLGVAFAAAATLILAWLLSKTGCTQTNNPTQSQSIPQQTTKDTSITIQRTDTGRNH